MGLYQKNCRVDGSTCAPRHCLRCAGCVLAGGKHAWSTDLEGVVIPVVDRSCGLDLRGKTLQIVMTRDFRSLPPDVVEKLNETGRTIWTGVAESETQLSCQ